MSGLLHTLSSRVGDNLIYIVVDTPKGSRHKFKYDEKTQAFCLSRILPSGAFFPYDFGSIPQTLAADGDALDVLVLDDAPSFVGCLMTGRLIGTISAEQTEKGKTIRNDRLLAVPVTSVNPAEITHIEDLPVARIDEIEHFFISYNRAHGREYRPIGRGGPAQAEKALAFAEQRYLNQHKP